MGTADSDIMVRPNGAISIIADTINIVALRMRSLLEKFPNLAGTPNSDKDCCESMFNTLALLFNLTDGIHLARDLIFF